ncbi:MAG: leucine-rich repeat protein [Ruminococcus sp.]|nr:leucine-rich repeat protein [Ruminococcus sp.]
MKINKIFAVLLTVINLHPFFVHSENVSEEIVYNGMTFQHQQWNPDELILTHYTGIDENIVIPENIGGYTVTAIDHYVFAHRSKLKNVTLPDTINSFGCGVFWNSSLVSVNIPKNLRIIPMSTFESCQELETVIFHDDILVISHNAFEKTDIEIPPELCDTVIEEYIYSSDSYIPLITGDWRYTLMNNHGDIHIRMKYYLGNDTEVTVPDYINDIPVTSISTGLDSSIKKLTLPATIKDLEGVTFKSPELEEITLPYIEMIPNFIFKDCPKLRKINFRGNPETFIIGENAFKNCTSLDYIPYPESCKNLTIRRNAFENTGIQEVKIDIDSEINEYAFRNCENLSYAELNNADIKSRAFGECHALEDVTINDNSTLEESSFCDCNMLKNMTFSDFNISMKNAVENCPELMTINNLNAFDNTTGDFNKDLKDFIFSNFNGVDDVGFINRYIKAQAQKIINENISENMTDIQKIKAVHDWICKNTVYDNGLSSNKKNHNDASVLMNDSTVCEGYARIANILYNTAGIETYYISGVGHAWNVVRAGNNYFHVDTTWDDGDKISYEWFMKSDDEIRNSDSYHTSWKTYIPSSLHEFQSDKKLPECNYSIGDVNQDSNTNIADMVMLNKYILGQDNIDYDSYILSDLTFDGVVDSFDLVRMRQKLINQRDNI